jgi:hypothetical protein
MSEARRIEPGIIERQYWEARAPIDKDYGLALDALEKLYTKALAPLIKQYRETIAAGFIEKVGE